jgi:hypothetical protein
VFENENFLSYLIARSVDTIIYLTLCRHPFAVTSTFYARLARRLLVFGRASSEIHVCVYEILTVFCVFLFTDTKKTIREEIITLFIWLITQFESKSARGRSENRKVIGSFATFCQNENV